MFDASIWEFLLVFVIALLVLGPERLPRAAHTAGLWLARARNAMRRLQREVQREFLIEETRAAAEKARAAAEKVRTAATDALAVTEKSNPVTGKTGSPDDKRQTDSSSGNS